MHDPHLARSCRYWAGVAPTDAAGRRQCGHYLYSAAEGRSGTENKESRKSGWKRENHENEIAGLAPSKIEVVEGD
jgi:hypothetical protein